MRFLPVFLDLQAGPVLLVGAGELARVKLRLLGAANARVRWYAADGHHDVSGLETTDIARIELANDGADDLVDKFQIQRSATP